MKGSCIRCALCVSDVTGFGTFDNSTRKRVLDLLEPGDVRLGQVVIERVAVVKLGVNNGSDDGGRCFGIELGMDGYSEADEYDNSKICRQMTSDLVFSRLRYEGWPHSHRC